MTDNQFPHIGITGALGGLGSSLTLSFLQSGWTVTGLDVMAPASAPEPYFKHRLELLSQNPGFNWQPIDIRSNEARDLLGREGIDLWIHAATMYPAATGLFIPAVYNKQLEQFFVATKQLVSGTSCPWIIVTHEQNACLSDSLFRAEQDLIENLDNSKRITFAPLPDLWGTGQSPYQFPLFQIRRLVGRLPLVTPEPDTANLLHLRDATEWIVQLVRFKLGKTAEIPDAPQSMEVSQQQILFRAAQHYRLPVLSDVKDKGGEHETIPLPENVSLPGMLDEQLVELLNWRNDLPFEPPLDWPTRKRDRKKKKKRRRS